MHGWWFDIANADVLSFSEKKGEYVLIDDAKAEELLQRLQIDPNKRLPSDGLHPYWLEPFNKN